MPSHNHYSYSRWFLFFFFTVLEVIYWLLCVDLKLLQNNALTNHSFIFNVLLFSFVNVPTTTTKKVDSSPILPYWGNFQTIPVYLHGYILWNCWLVFHFIFIHKNENEQSFECVFTNDYRRPNCRNNVLYSLRCVFHVNMKACSSFLVA